MVAAHHRPVATIVIPILNDAAALADALAALPVDSGAEVVVVDGGAAHDPLLEMLRARYPEIAWVRSAPGRGRQMNEGARRGHGRWLVFLHADTRLGDGWTDALRSLDEQHRIVGGSFRFVLDSPARQARWVERGVWFRVRLLNLPYGDQALFARRTVFEALGGYQELPLMEDVDFIRRLGRRGRLAHLKIPAITSARRWERDGWVRRSVENVVLTLLYFAGRAPELLARRYHRGMSPAAMRDRGRADLYPPTHHDR